MIDFCNLSSAEGILTIRCKETGEILVNKRNAIHFGNLSPSIASALAGSADGHIKYLSFGNGGTSLTPSGTIFYRSPNVSTLRDENADLYNETYKKDVSVGTTENNVAVELSESTYADVVITCTLGFGEPTGQDLVDNAGDFDGAFVFDEIGVKNGDGDGVLLTHVLFHPVQKTLNRSLEVEYVIRIQMGSAD